MPDPTIITVKSLIFVFKPYLRMLMSGCLLIDASDRVLAVYLEVEKNRMGKW